MSVRRASRPRRGRVGAPTPSVILPAVLLLLSGLRLAAGQAESLDIEQIAQRDLYAVLELQPGAPAPDVKTAYRKLAKKWHPDKNPEDTQTAQNRFAEIAEAYEVLSDETSRELYDHARRVRAAHDDANNDGPDSNGHYQGRWGEGGGAADWKTGSEWFYADGADWDEFGSSFSGAGGAGAGFGSGFGSGPFGGGGGGGGGGGAGRGGGGGAYEFRARDPMELFEALFGGGFFDGAESDLHYMEDPYDYEFEQQQQHQQQQQQRQQGTSWDGQNFEEYQYYQHGGQSFRRVITTDVLGDGVFESTAQDFVFDHSRQGWFEMTDVFEYHGPGVAPARERGWVGQAYGNGRSDSPKDNFLRMGEFLQVGETIASADRKFAAVLENDCNLVVYHRKGVGEGVKVWETSSFDPEGRCFVAIQDNGMLVVMAGTDPTAPGNVLWSSNRAHVGWLRQSAFHATVLTNGNLVVSQGESPAHPAARKFVWGAFGCPGDGGVMEWKLVWMSLRTKAGDIWCKVSGCDGDAGYYYDGGGGSNPFDSDPYDNHAPPGSWDWRSGASGDSGGVNRDDFDPLGGGGFRGEILKHPGAALKKAAGQGVAWLTEALGKLKAAAEDTAYAASRPRHW